MFAAAFLFIWLSFVTQATGSIARSPFLNESKSPDLGAQLPGGLVSITTESDLYKSLQPVINDLFAKVLNGSLICPHDVILHHQNHTFPLFTVTAEMLLNPFLIAQNLIIWIFQWYKFQFSTHHLYLPEFHGLSQLVDLLLTFQETANLGSFEILINSLDSLFKARNGGIIWPFYRWLFYDEYIAMFSDHKLKVIGKLGEGSQGIVFKVQCTTNDKIFALKLFNDMFDPFGVWNDCRSEERVLLKINKINDMVNHSVSVPRLITAIDDGVDINCMNHRALLMGFIDGQRFENHVFSEHEALAMYSQLSSTITTLAHFGISHNDIYDGNIMVDRNGTHWLIDFGLSLDFDAGFNRREPIIANWVYYSPSMWHLSMLMICGRFANDFHHDQREYVKSLILNGNLYSLSAVIMDRITAMARPSNERRLARMVSEVEYIWSSYGSQRWNEVGDGLRKIWSVRTGIVRQYLWHHQNSEFKQISLLLTQSRWDEIIGCQLCKCSIQ